MDQKLACNVRLANAMSEPSHKSELITQIFQHDRVALIQDGAIWVQIKMSFNDTVAWVLKAQFSPIDESQFVAQPIGMYDVFVSDEVSVKPYLPGTFEYNEAQSIHLISDQYRVRNEENIKRIALSFLNAPYMWGGITNMGIDCSGLSQIVYRFFGVALTSFAAEQFLEGKVLDFLQDAQCGDLAFFENEEGAITHVGVMLSSNEIIHATETAGKVVIDNIDQEGIIRKVDGKRTHKLRVVKRL